VFSSRDTIVNSDVKSATRHHPLVGLDELFWWLVLVPPKSFKTKSAADIHTREASSQRSTPFGDTDGDSTQAERSTALTVRCSRDRQQTSRNSLSRRQIPASCHQFFCLLHHGTPHRLPKHSEASARQSASRNPGVGQSRCRECTNGEARLGGEGGFQDAVWSRFRTSPPE
jgi:hypothetical protein